MPERLDMEIRYYYKNGKTGFQTAGGCHLAKACWDEAWLLDDTDRALVRDSEGYAPVSYTHLDVYKRQSFFCSCIMIGF